MNHEKKMREKAEKLGLCNCMWHGCKISQIEKVTQAILEARAEAFEEAAKLCCTIDSSDSSHETAESNAKAIRAAARGESK